MQRPAALTLAIAIGLSSAATVALSADTAPSKSAAKSAPRPATPREELKSEAKGLALATETTEAISAAQLDIAARVLTGKADCEDNQAVDVDAMPGKPGMFKVRFKGANYVMVPEETTTGAVRLTDRKAEVVWLQIPAKSMLLNNRAGHRMVDRCTHAEQRAAVEAVTGAAATAAAKAGAPADPAVPRK
jgi:hypothetical protein